MRDSSNTPKRSPQRRARALAGLTLVSVGALTPAAAQQSAVDHFLATPMDLARASKPPVAITPTSESAPVPFDVEQTANGISVRTGLSTWSAYNARDLRRRLETAKALAPADLRLPKSPTPLKQPLDVWTKVDAENGAFESTQTLRTSVGADYRLFENAKAGVSARQSDTSTMPGASPVPSDRQFSAYMNLKASSMLSVDAKTQWQRVESEAGAGIAGRERNSFSLAPKLEHKFDIGDGVALSPYATVKHQLDINTLDGAEHTTNSAGGGITLAKPDAYSVTVSTDVQQSSNADTPSINSKLQFKLPLP